MAKKFKTRAPTQAKKKKIKPAPKTEAPNSDAPPSSPDPGQQPGNSKFVDDLLARNEAAELDENGKLPLHATHIVKKNPDGTVQVKRARFKAF